MAAATVTAAIAARAAVIMATAILVAASAIATGAAAILVAASAIATEAAVILAAVTAVATGATFLLATTVLVAAIAVTVGAAIVLITVAVAIGAIAVMVTVLGGVAIADAVTVLGGVAVATRAVALAIGGNGVDPLREAFVVAVTTGAVIVTVTVPDRVAVAIGASVALVIVCQSLHLICLLSKLYLRLDLGDLIGGHVLDGHPDGIQGRTRLNGSKGQNQGQSCCFQ
jgi:hypothetical protein